MGDHEIIVRMVAKSEELDVIMESELISSIEHCYDWAKTWLRDQPKTRIEFKVRNSLQQLMEESMINKIDKAIATAKRDVGSK
jgi:fructose-1,6-bisphosphatase